MAKSLGAYSETRPPADSKKLRETAEARRLEIQEPTPIRGQGRSSQIETLLAHEYEKVFTVVLNIDGPSAPAHTHAPKPSLVGSNSYLGRNLQGQLESNFLAFYAA